MNDIFEKIKKKYADLWLELLLAGLVIFVFFIMMGLDDTKETFSEQDTSETLLIIETENESSSESAKGEAVPGKSGDREEETSEESEEEKSEKETSEEGLSKETSSEQNSGEEENEKDKAEEEPQEETEDLVEAGIRKLFQQERLKAMYGEDFVIPQKTERELSSENRLEFPLDFGWEIPGYELPKNIQRERTMAELKMIIENMVGNYDGTWSVYLKRLDTGESFVINDVSMKSASVMKLFILGTVYEAFETGELERSEEVMSLVNSMISYSDNACSNELLYRLGDGSYEQGIARVDMFIASHGFSDMTVEYNGFNDPATNMGTGQFNQVAAKDCGKLLEDIYRRIWVNREVSNEIEQMMLNQQTRYKIPAGLPEGVLCGNKTGEMDTTENDAAIVYSDACDYILVVLSSEWGSKDEAIYRIQDISKRVYEYLNIYEYDN